MDSWKWCVALVIGAITGGLVVFSAQSYFAPNIRLADVNILIKARDYDRAQKQLETFLRRNPGEPQAHLMLAGVLTTRGDPEKPLEHLQQIPDTSAWAIEARFREGYMLRQLGRTAQAEAAWLRCLAVDESVSPGDMNDMARNASVELLMMYDMQRRKRVSRELLWRWYRRVAEADRVRALIMMLHMEFGAAPPIEDIVANLKRFLAADPQDIHSRRSLGRLYVESGQDEQQGLELLKTCTEQQPDDLDSFVDYVWCLTEKGDLAAAEAAVAHLPAGADKNAELWELRGIVYELKEQWQDAARCFRQSLSLEPWRRKPHGHLVNVLRRQGDTETADEHEKRAKELFDTEERLASAAQWTATTQVQPAAGSSFDLGELHERRGRIDEARAWYAETVRQDPKHAGASDGLGRLGRPIISR